MESLVRSEESGARSQEPEKRCEKLRWKGMFIHAEILDPSIQHSNDHAYWCQHTFKCLGPDGKAVGNEECAPGRECYEEL